MFLNFLEESQPTAQLSAFSDSYDFVRGFINGTEVVKGVPSVAECNPVTEKMNASVNAFIQAFNNITTENYKEVIANATAIGRDIYDEFTKALPKCIAVAVESSNFTQRVIHHMTEDGYISKILSHATQNLIEVFQKVARIQGHVSAARHFEAGQESGIFFTFLFFHDFILAEPTPVLALFNIKSQAPAKFTGAQEFGQGFVNGTKVLLALPSINDCDPVNNKTMELAVLFIETAKNITIDNYMTQLTKLYQVGLSLYTEIQTGIPKCSAAVNETTILINKLSAHVGKSGYVDKIMSHAVGNIFEIISRVSKIQSFFGGAQHFNAGQESGAFFTFFFLHDFIL